MTFSLKKEHILLFLVLTVAIFFRFYKIDSLPGGLFPDEAANGEDALSILNGDTRAFYERGLGREALYFYLLAISIKLFGIGVWQIHIVSALIGILTILAGYMLAKELFNSRVAFFAGIFLATSYWHTTLSRTGFRAILLPLFSSLFFYFILVCYKTKIKKNRFIFATLAGISLALGLYTYPSFRFMAVIMSLMGSVLLIFKRNALIENWKEICLGLLSFVVVVAPLALYFMRQPDMFFGRASYVSIFNSDINKGDLAGTFFDVLKKTILMFFTKGDLNWRHNVSGMSMINPFISLLFALGFTYSFYKIIKTRIKYLFLVIWFLIMLFPALLTSEGIPHGLRVIGVLPVIFYFPAIALDKIIKRVQAQFPSKYAKKSLQTVVIAMLFLSAAYNFYLYFGISAQSPGFHYDYRSDLTIASAYINKRNKAETTYLVLDEYSVQTPDFLTTQNNQPYKLLRPYNLHELNAIIGDQVIFTQSTLSSTRYFSENYPEANIVNRSYNIFKEEIMRVYEI